MEPMKYSWSPETGVATCQLFIDRNHIYEGQAICAEQDTDMKSEKTGCHIATERAKLAWYKDMRDELSVQSVALRHVISLMRQAPGHDEASPDYQTAVNELRRVEDELSMTRDIINFTRNFLSDYISEKDKFYKGLRRLRKVQSGDLSNEAVIPYGQN